ncbi:hypothetical protein [Hymenobacter latericus]|uniref:hypothetical protein n=1 Tax=Hymenobacter sp. YIM 151858-1 TaxID=2987688 RepID=UPI0022275BFB|nr:hypothetical protein [Hymenobacter sp. YIM 151858-1]UYZ61152.1 hypothetical protein OIS50_19475 [Hymenobacter sp. YIM 151858-1]
MKHLIRSTVAIFLILWSSSSLSAQAIVSAPVLEGQSFMQTGLQATMKGLEAKANVLIDKGVVEQTLTKTYSKQNMLLHKEWYEGLLKISEAVRTYRRVQHIFERQAAMIKIYSDYITRFTTDDNLNPQQRAAIGKAYAGLLREGAGMLDELKVLVNPAGAKMTDAERLELIDALDERITRHYDLLVYFTRRSQALSRQQAVQLADRRLVEKLYGVAP